MKKYLVLAGIMAVLAIFGPASVYAYTDANGNPLWDGDLISANRYGDPDIYIIKISPHDPYAGYKRLFLNPAIFSFYGHLGGFANVRPVTPQVRDLFQTSGLFRNCETGDQKVWATELTGEDTGVFHHVQLSGDAAVAEDPYFFRKVFCINTREENFYAKSIHEYVHLNEVPSYERKTCLPRPACLDATAGPRCLPPEPLEGWCPPTPTPTPLPTPVVSGGCYVGGCSNELCSDRPNVASTCMYRDEYVCYRKARCERQYYGQCGWTQTPELSQCLYNPIAH